MKNDQLQLVPTDRDELHRAIARAMKGPRKVRPRKKLPVLHTPVSVLMRSALRALQRAISK